MLAILPGKHLLSMLANVLGLSHTSELTSIVVRSLNRRQLKKDDPLLALGAKVETALLAYLPARHTEPPNNDLQGDAPQAARA